MTRNIDDMTAEARLEREWLDVGQAEKVSDALCRKGIDPKRLGGLTNFVNKRFRPWPEKLAEAASYAEDLDAALVAANAPSYVEAPEDERKGDLLRIVVWRVFEAKLAAGSFADRNVAGLVNNTRGPYAVKAILGHLVGNQFKRLKAGDLLLDEVTKKQLWDVFTEFALEAQNAYTLEPLKRMGLLEAPQEETEEEEAA